MTDGVHIGEQPDFNRTIRHIIEAGSQTLRFEPDSAILRHSREKAVEIMRNRGMPTDEIEKEIINAGNGHTLSEATKRIITGAALVVESGRVTAEAAAMLGQTQYDPGFTEGLLAMCGVAAAAGFSLEDQQKLRQQEQQRQQRAARRAARLRRNPRLSRLGSVFDRIRMAREGVRTHNELVDLGIEAHEEAFGQMSEGDKAKFRQGASDLNKSLRAHDIKLEELAPEAHAALTQYAFRNGGRNIPPQIIEALRKNPPDYKALETFFENQGEDEANQYMAHLMGKAAENQEQQGQTQGQGQTQSRQATMEAAKTAATAFRSQQEMKKNKPPQQPQTNTNQESTEEGSRPKVAAAALRTTQGR